jgi:hypothetical protein
MTEVLQGVLDIQEFAREDYARYAAQLGVVSSVETAEADERQYLLRREINHPFNGTTAIVVERACDAAGQPIRGSVPYVSLQERI